MIDTHCHIDDPQYTTDLDTFLSNQRAAGVEKILVPGVNAASIATVGKVCRLYPNFLYPAIGLHPEEVKDDWKEQLSLIAHALATEYSPTGSTPCIAIGEIGLDYHFDTTFRQQQLQAFRQQLLWAIERDLPVMIHCRDAMEDTLQIIHDANTHASQQQPGKTIQGVMHCFSGSHESAEIILKMGLYLGIGGVITFKNCRLAEHLHGIPLDRLVLETDAPYMAPVPHRGQRNESRWMELVAQRLGEVYGIATEEVKQQTTLNAKRLFRLE